MWKIVLMPEHISLHNHCFLGVFVIKLSLLHKLLFFLQSTGVLTASSVLLPRRVNTFLTEFALHPCGNGIMEVAAVIRDENSILFVQYPSES